MLLLGAHFAWRQFYSEKARIVQIDAAPDHFGRRHPVTLGLVGDIKSTMEALLPRLKPRVSTAFRDKLVGRHIRAAETHRAKVIASSRGTIPPIYLTELINKHAANDALFCADDGDAHGLALSAHRYERKTPGVFEPSPRHDGGGLADVGTQKAPLFGGWFRPANNPMMVSTGRPPRATCNDGRRTCVIPIQFST